MTDARVPEDETEIFEEERVTEPAAAERVNRLAEARPTLVRVRLVKETIPVMGRRRKQFEDVKFVRMAGENETVEKERDPPVI
jgi:hypothetical protein